MFYTIYKITNKINNKIYIGKHKTENLDDGYMGSGTLLLKAYKKYGMDNFTKEILFIFDTELQMNLKEKELVTEDFCRKKDNYNLVKGGFGGFNYINEHENSKKWKREAWKKQDELYRELYGDNYKSILQKQVMHELKSDEQRYNEYRKTISTALKEYYKTNKNGFHGKSHSEETKNKMRKPKNVGKNNPSFGTMWVTNGKENKKIKKEDLLKWEESGYYRGRLINKDLNNGQD